jgi:hypothetical protein
MTEEKKEKAIVRIRKAEFAGAEDKFYAPSDDIRNCSLSIIRGGLEAVTARYPELQEKLSECAVALAEYYQQAFLAEDKVPALMSALTKKLFEIDETAARLCLSEIAISMLTYYGVAQRETTGHADLTKPQIERIASVGAMLAWLDEEDRKKVTKILSVNRLYPEELDRDPQEGQIIP